MKTVFADTGYWIAMLNPKDGLHHKARNITRDLMPLRIVTSEMVFTELLNAFSKEGIQFRRAAFMLIEKSSSNPNIEIVSQTTELFQSALKFYYQRLDKNWSHTDCASFQRELTSCRLHKGEVSLTIIIANLALLNAEYLLQTLQHRNECRYRDCQSAFENPFGAFGQFC